jgi:shikimate kinase
LCNKIVCMDSAYGEKSNIVLIGMPGSGKSTLGVILAKLTSRGFIDTDVLIQAAEGRPLQDIVDSQGYMELRSIEERIILGLDCRNHVIATGGSAVYSVAAMEHLAAGGVIVFLDVDLTTLQLRVRDMATRGLAKRPDQSFEDLFAERCSLYRKYADCTIPCGRLSHDDACAAIISCLAFQRINRGERVN